MCLIIIFQSPFIIRVMTPQENDQSSSEEEEEEEDKITMVPSTPSTVIKEVQQPVDELEYQLKAEELEKQVSLHKMSRLHRLPLYRAESLWFSKNISLHQLKQCILTIAENSSRTFLHGPNRWDML